MPQTKPSCLIIFLAIIFPALLVIGQTIAEHLWLTLPQKEWLLSENGPYEFAQFIVLMIAALVAGWTLAHMNHRTDRLLTAWIALALVCCLYVGGEEISWGQHLFFWSTPESWAELNDQGETNLHNVSAWFDQKPRLILEIGIIIGGILLPLYRWLRPHGLPKRFELFYPTNTLVPLAVLATLTKQGQSLVETLDIGHLFHRISEVQEFLFFLFVLVYLVILRGRIVTRDNPQPV